MCGTVVPFQDMRNGITEWLRLEGIIGSIPAPAGPPRPCPEGFGDLKGEDPTTSLCRPYWEGWQVMQQSWENPTLGVAILFGVSPFPWDVLTAEGSGDRSGIIGELKCPENL